jgi:hypothetical protein
MPGFKRPGGSMNPNDPIFTARALFQNTPRQLGLRTLRLHHALGIESITNFVNRFD